MEDGYSIKTITTFREMEEIRDDWNMLSWHFFADIDYFGTMAGVRPEFVRPHIIVVSRNGKTKTIIVGKIHQQKMVCRFSYKDIYAPDIRHLYIEHGGVLGDESLPMAEIVVAEIGAALKRGDADVAFFNHLPVDSEIFRLALTNPSILARDHTTVKVPHWTIDLPDTFEAYMQAFSSKHRYWFRRMEKGLQKSQGGEIVFRSFSLPEDVEPFCRDAETIARRTYQRGLGAGFIYNEEMAGRLRLASSSGWMWAYILYANGNPTSFWAATLYKKVLFLDSTGYLPEFRQYEPGTILLLKMIESLYSDAEPIRRIDFGFGDAPYKQRFSNGKWEEASVFISAPTLKGIRLNLVRSAVAASSTAVMAIMDRMKITQKVKKFWRGKLVSRA